MAEAVCQKRKSKSKVKKKAAEEEDDIEGDIPAVPDFAEFLEQQPVQNNTEQDLGDSDRNVEVDVEQQDDASKGGIDSRVLPESHETVTEDPGQCGTTQDPPADCCEEDNVVHTRIQSDIDPGGTVEPESTTEIDTQVEANAGVPEKLDNEVEATSQAGNQEGLNSGTDVDSAFKQLSVDAKVAAPTEEDEREIANSNAKVEEVVEDKEVVVKREEDTERQCPTLQIGQEAKLYPDLSEQLANYNRQPNEGPNMDAVAPRLPAVGTAPQPAMVGTAPQGPNMGNVAPRQAVVGTAPQLAQIDVEDVSTKVTQPAPQPREAVQTLTMEQLSSLYYNEQLERNGPFIEKFVQRELQRDSHEFYEILLNYQRARKNLVQCELALHTLEERYTSLQAEIWVTETHTATAKGVCGDNAHCTTNHTYSQARLNGTALEELRATLERLEAKIQDELSLYSYSSQLSCLQVESYIHNLFVSSPILRDIPRNLPVHACDHLSTDAAHQLERLKTCISILFCFHRLPIDDEVMVKNLQNWTERLVSACLRACTFWDHLFILNHYMRCPAGIGSWAASFVQAPAIPANENVGGGSPKFGNVCLDHAITALATVLMPASGRTDFLCHMQKMFTPGPDQKTISWVMVDSDGEEDEDAQNAWKYLHENDVVVLLKQFPLAAIFRHIFFVEQSQFQDSYEYDIEKTTESVMYRVFAFCTCLVRLLGAGLHTYNMGRYRQLNKRLGRMIRQSVQFVSDHWHNFRAFRQGVMSNEALQRLQAEFDAFFLRAVNLIYISHRLGCCQFIADMPFENISTDTMWKLLWLLHQGPEQTVDIQAIPPAKQCRQFVKDSSSRSLLCDILQRVPASEGLYLLNTMTNMTECCSSANLDIIETVTMTVFEVSYICPETRDSCSKMGRELLSAVVMCHPFVLSTLTCWVHDYMDKLGAMGVYLYSGLSLEAWLPGDPDLLIVRQWLLTSDLGSPQNQLAQLILGKINWGLAHKGDRLTVPWRVHKQVSVLVVEAYQRFIMGKHLGSVIMEGVKQLSAAVQQYSTSEQEFNSWCWDLLLRLSLHRGCLPADDLRVVEFQGPAPDLNQDNALLGLGKGIKERNTAACFVAIVLSKIGHSIADFLTDGLPLLEVLVSQGLYKATICAIYYTLTLFADNHKYILDSIRFQEMLLSILHADESYFKIVKGLLSYDFPGPITKLFISMIQSQINSARQSDYAKMVAIIEMWTKLILKIPKWHLDRNCCCVVDSLIASSYTHTPAIDTIHRVVKEHYKEYCHQEKNQGMVSALVSWVTSGTSLPSLQEKASCGEFSWLAHMLLTLEGEFETDSNLWQTIHDEMHTNLKLNADQALRKAVAKLKLDQAPVTSRMNIYRLAQQALDTPVGHPVAVLTWQRFFVFYLGRYVTNTSLPQRASVGERFFSSMGYSSMVKKMKKRLGETADHYQKLSAQDHTDDSDSDPASSDGGGRHDFYCGLVRLFRTYQLWVEEPRLHDASLYLPSLPQQYQSDRLLQVFQNNMAPWLEFLDSVGVESSVVSMAKEWRETSTPDQNVRVSTPRIKKDSRPASVRILSRLSRCEEPLPPPPVQPVKAPVPELSPTVLEDRGSILHLLQSDLDMLKNFASQFCSRMSQQVTKDHYYTSLIPNLYKNVPREVTVSLHCTSMINPLHRCNKPGSAVVKIDEKWGDPIVQRDADENRAEFKQLLVENKHPPPQNIVICAVHTENAITMLVKLSRSCTDERRQKLLSEIACSLFFRFGATVTETIQRYPPTQQFFSACMDVLGKEFIEREPGQVEPLLKLAIERPELGGLLSPHFIPLLAPDKFVRLYTRLVETLQRKTLELTFMLLTKFDVSKWLTEHGPSKQEVKVFVEQLGQAFITCGAEPDDQHRLVFELYLGHEKILLRHRFPLYLHQVIAAVLHGSSIQKVSVACWEVLQRSCFHDNQAGAEEAQTGARYPQVFTNLSTEEVRNLLYWFGHEFMQIRQKQKDTTTFGLYPSWQRYVPHVAGFLRDLAKCLVDKMVPTLADATTNEALENVWRSVVEAFAPWLQPIFHDKAAPNMPWIAADMEHARCMVQAFVEVLGFAHCRTEEIRGKFYHDFLSLLWLYFASALCKPEVSPDVVAVFNMEIASLPWQQLVPNIQVMEIMAQMKELGSPMGFNLVSDVVAEVPWDRVVAWYETCHPLDVRRRFEGALIILLVQAFGEHKHIENPDMERVISAATSYSWQHLAPDAYRKACSLFLLGSDPKCLLVERTAPETIGLRLMKSAAGFTVEVSHNWTVEWSARRLNFLHCLASLICQCTYVTDWDQSLLSNVIINLLTEIETLESAVLDGYTQREESSDMAREVLSLLNNCKPDGEGTRIVMTGILQWLHDSPQTILLSPVIHAATRHLASLTCMAQITEQCIELAFVPSGSSSDGSPTASPWDSVLAALQIPELSLTEFIEACLAESSFLLLHGYILQREPLCQNLSEEQGIVEMILDWTDKAKPSAENESKLLLWWHKVLDLVLRQLDYGRDVITCVGLVRKFVSKMQSYGEDRASGGLLGAIGLGKRSALSMSFRVCSRAIVAFISCQIISDAQFRIHPSDPAPNTPAAKQDLSNLKALKTNKKYQPIRKEIESICDFVTDQSKCLYDVRKLLLLLRLSFYQDKHYLSVIRSS